MNDYRVTKYDPRFRASSGAYTRDEWTSFKDIGSAFAGVTLTPDEYDRVEAAYIAAAVAYLREAGVEAVTVRDLENHAGSTLAFRDGDALAVERLPEVIGRLLRAEFWCRLEAADAFVHVGYDFYMYIGVPRPCPMARREVEKRGLFIEEFSSPYRDA